MRKIYDIIILTSENSVIQNVFIIISLQQITKMSMLLYHNLYFHDLLKIFKHNNVQNVIWILLF